ncbi:Late embryogenesis abundant protein [Macleaya cordata]|uniref:Late embryogenesis abundant protein n=1 Tax=Macleaya cordata TaxID=56857 RepID=A0A200QJP8_MACCD|nr:Late embryogenesis abundant protein [Macleaya cordata]
MADHQRIHPVTDVEAPPTVPLVPRGSSRSEKGDPINEYYPPFRRTIPVIHTKPPRKKRSCCCKCICWTLSLLILLLIILGATAGILYAVFKPKLPKYSIDRLRITDFRLNNDSSLFAEFKVRITTTNPNKKIGIYYEDGSHLNVWYKNFKLCEGFLPKFYQGHQNITVLDLGLTGQNEDGNSLMTALFEQQQTGSIPLDLNVKVPVRVKLGKLKLMKVKFKVRCKLVVDSLSTDNLIRIRSSSCKFKLRI